MGNVPGDGRSPDDGDVDLPSEDFGRPGGGGAPAARGGSATEANTLGVDMLKQQQYDEAIRQFKMALSCEPDSVQILNNIGLAYAKLHNFDSAYEWYAQAYRSDESDIETLFSLAWVERKRQNFRHARELFLKVLDMEPQHVKALYLLGDILRNTGDHDGAIRFLERLAKLDPNSADGHLALAQCYEHSKQYSRAAQIYNHVVTIAPNRSDVVFFLGRMYYFAGQYRQSVVCLDRIKDSDARAFDARTYAAKAYRELEDSDNAISNAERAAKCRPHEDVFYFLGEQYMRKGDKAKGMHWLARALELDRNHVPSHLEMGKQLSKQFRWAEAEVHFACVCDMERNSSTAHQRLAQARFKQKKFEACRQACDVVLRADLLQADALWLLAECHRLDGTGEDRWYLKLRYPADVSVADVCQNLARSYLKRDQGKEALSWLLKVQHYHQTDGRVREAIALLKTSHSVKAQDVIDMLERGDAAVPVISSRMSADNSAAGYARDRRAPPDDRRQPSELASRFIPPSESPEELERLLRRAERANGRAGGTAAWQELLTSARQALRSRPDDKTPMRCVARALLATNGDAAEIRELSRRVMESDDNGGSPLGYELHTHMGGVCEKEQDFASADRHFVAALGSKPGDEVAMLGLARTYVQRNEGAKARKIYDQVIASNPNCAEAAARLSEVLLELDDPPEAHRYAQRAVKLVPSDARAFLALGKACAALSRADDAVRAFEQAHALQPSDISAMMTIASLQRKVPGKEQEAITWYKRVLDIKPGDYHCNLRLGELYAAKGSAGASQSVHYLRTALQSRPPTSEARDIALQMAVVQAGIGSWKDAQQTLEGALRENPDDEELVRRLLEVSEQTKDAKLQVHCREKLKSAGADSVAKLVAQGDAAQSQGNLEGARSHFEQALRVEPANAPVRLKLAAAWRQENSLEKALQDYDQVLKLDPNSAEALEGAAYCHRKLSNLDKAVQLYKECLRVTSSPEGPLYYLGEILYRLQGHRECQIYLRRLVDMNGSQDYRLSALYTLAKSHVSLDDYDEAETIVRSGLDMSPNHTHFLFILALVKNRQADYDTSIKILEQARHHAETGSDRGSAGSDQLLTEIHDWLAQAYERKKDYRLAMVQLELALKRHPSHVSSLITKAHVHIQLKQQEQAEGALKRALSVEKGNALALVRFGYCKLLASDYAEATSYFQRAVNERCGTVALPRSVKGTARIYMALATMAQQDLDGALLHLKEARKDHQNFSTVCTSAKDFILKGECEELISQLRGISDLDVTPAQAWQLVHMLAKGLELGIGQGRANAAAAPAQRAPPGDPPAGAWRDEPAPARDPAQRRAWAADPAGGGAAAAAGAVAAAGANVASQPTGVVAPPEGQTPLTHDRRRWSQASVEAEQEKAAQAAQAQAQKAKQTAHGKLRLALSEQLDYDELTQYECLGTGGFGAVYRGLFKGNEVAIKKLFCEDGGNISPLQLEELSQEVAALRGLNHARLVSFIGACLQPPNLCIITEFMPNGSLHYHLHKAKTMLTVAQQGKLALQITEGVAFLHSLHPPVVHRDLKSMNIVLDNDFNAKICDFGLTQSMEKTHISLKDGGNGGSPRYMAPECYNTEGKITEKVDVWALGCILIEVFGGPLPYHDCINVHQILKKLVLEMSVPFIPHDLPHGVRSVVEECFEFDIKVRTSAQEAYSRLRHLRVMQALGE